MSSPISTIGRYELFFNYSTELVTLNQKCIQHIAAAKESPNLNEKRAIYELAFKELHQYIQENRCDQASPEVAKLHGKLLLAYASDTCYAQASEITDQHGKSVDSEEGFRKSALLMELSFCIQLTSLNALTFYYPPYYLTSFPSIEEILRRTGNGKDQQGEFFRVILLNNFDEDVLVQKADEYNLRESLTQTLIHMTYAHQNISMLREDAVKGIHTKYQTLTEKMIGRETESQKKELCSYLNYRCSFLVDIETPEDYKKKIASYNPVLKLLKEIYPKDHPDYISRYAQIYNMAGLILLEHGMPVTMAQAYFFKALQWRSTLMSKIYDENQKFEQEYLMSNLRASIIHCIIKTSPLDKEALIFHKEALEAFLVKMQEKGNQHSYRGSYFSAIANANYALGI